MQKMRWEWACPASPPTWLSTTRLWSLYAWTRPHPSPRQTTGQFPPRAFISNEPAQEWKTLKYCVGTVTDPQSTLENQFFSMRQTVYECRLRTATLYSSEMWLCYYSEMWSCPVQKCDTVLFWMCIRTVKKSDDVLLRNVTLHCSQM